MQEGHTLCSLAGVSTKCQHRFIFILSQPSRNTPDAAHRLFEGRDQLIKQGESGVTPALVLMTTCSHSGSLQIKLQTTGYIQ